jgi:outer membrane immunogenic protein
VRIRPTRACSAHAVVLTISVLSCLNVTPARAQTAPIWTGLYAGIQGGGTWAEVDTDIGDFTSRDAVWGLHAGYNLVNGRILIGIESDVNFAGANLDGVLGGVIPVTAETDWSGSIRARFGVITGPLLLFGTVGYAHLESNLTATAPTGQQYRDTQTLTGIVYGVGAEAFVVPNVSLRLEALQYDYTIENDALSPYVDPSETVVRAGLTFHFN